jgi:hypothetical protein
VAYGTATESQGHVVLARSASLRADLRQAVPAVAAIVAVKGGGGPSLVELVTADPGRLKDAVAAAAAWLEENA